MKLKQIVFATRPNGAPGKANFRLEETDQPSLGEGEVLLTPLYISVDPYMRGRMNPQKSYIPPFELDKPIEGGILAVVEESKSPLLQKGDKVNGMLPWATRIVAKADTVFKVAPADVPDSYYLGVLGITGLTAYFGLIDICKPKAGETVVVSGAAGAVGTIVGQIAKLKGCRVIGIAGSDEKAALLKSKFGYDEVINYKNTQDLHKAVADACPAGVDCYFDNVGGDITDAVFPHLNFYARVAICGQIALYNDKELSTGPRILMTVLMKSVSLRGFVIMEYLERFGEGFTHLLNWYQEGKLNTTETIVEGFEQLPEAFLSLFTGSNTGKTLVKV